MEFQLIKIKNTEEINNLAAMADTIWHEYFVSIITEEQIDYMIEKFQSAPAITEQIINKGYEYYFLEENGEILGYTGICEEKATNKLFLSKLYLKKEKRGKGYASKAFESLEQLCKARGIQAIWLTVNRYNEHTIAVYKRKGFEILRTQAADIGNGFIMDDYIMELQIN